jgi:transcriptional regulator GlxA family with amidase domain
LRVAKVYLLKWHSEGQLPYASLVRAAPHADSIVRVCSNWLTDHFREPNAISGVEKISGLPGRSLKRRFKAAMGSTLIEHVQNLRVEEAKRLLETAQISVDEISAEVGYEDPAFFRRLFKRLTGLTPSEYRRMFRPIARGYEMGANR